MPTRARAAFLGARAVCAVALLAVLAGCGGSSGTRAVLSAPTRTPVACATAVLAALRGVGRRIYHEGISSERTTVARRSIAASSALGRAVERGDVSAARVAAEALVASGHVVSLTVLRNGRVLASAGTSHALAPFNGPIVGAAGAQVGTFITSVWGSTGLIEETTGV